MKHVITILFILTLPYFSYSKFISPDKKSSTQKNTTWIINKLPVLNQDRIQVLGTPDTVSCKYGKAIHFNGIDEGIFLDEMPLKDLTQFTIEVIFQPESGGNFEQRFFHCGEISGDRILLEIRTTENDWYFDAYIKTKDQQLALISPDFLHPLDEWYHVAYVVDNGKLLTYIDGKKELEGEIKMTPIQNGKCSFGVRQNLQSWFKGSIYSVKISPKAIEPKDFEMN